VSCVSPNLIEKIVIHIYITSWLVNIIDMDQIDIRYKLLSIMSEISRDGSSLFLIFKEFNGRFSHEFSSTDLLKTSTGELRWERSLREELIQCDVEELLIPSAPKHWRITEKGNKWLRSNSLPASQSRGHTEDKISSSISSNAAHKINPLFYAPEKGVIHISVVTNEQPISRAQSNKPRGVKKNIANSVLSSAMYEILEKEILAIQTYLQGRSVSQPGGEKLCDWVNFCYLLGYFAEGNCLFGFIDGYEVNHWYYDHTRSITQESSKRVKLYDQHLLNGRSELFRKTDPPYEQFCREFNRLKSFLDGVSNDNPTSEKICEWVNLCYFIKAYQEGTELFPYVDAAEVNEWYYERTKKNGAVV